MLLVATLNCNGLRNKEKRVELFTHLSTKRYDVVFLQETFWDKASHDIATREWGGHIHSSFFKDNRRRGVSCLIKKDADIETRNIKTDENGRFIQLDMSIDSQVITFISIYAPNIVTERANFFLDLRNKLNEIGNQVIISGDFNTVLNVYQDKYPPVSYPDNSRKPLNDIMSHFELRDIWRDKNPGCIEFSWTRHRTDGRFASRIDRFLVSKSLSNNIINCGYKPYPRSDHNLLDIQLDLTLIPKGPGIWILNNSILKDEVYSTSIRELINREKSHSNFNSNFMAWYGALKSKIKATSISFCKRKRKMQRKERKKLIKQINYENIKAQKWNDYDVSRLKRLEEELNIQSQTELMGAAIRSKIQWFEEGERSTKYFLNLERSRQKKKVIRQLVTVEGNVIDNQKLIINEQLRFYTNLYDRKPTNEHAINELLSHLSKSLSLDDTELCDEDLTINELKDALFTMEPNKSPGLDGITVEFYKTFWYDYVDIFERLIYEIINRNELCDSMKTSILTLIPKKGDLSRLTNWRPISLLNVDYKIISRSLAKRISSVIDKLVSTDQTCCVPERDITENVITMNNIIDYVNENDSDGYLLKIDQFKAFDSVNHDYLFSCIKRMGFGPYFLNWIKILYRGIHGCIKHNGYMSEFFPIKRGVRQGCPISALLYVLSAEPLHDVISNCSFISGITFCNTEAKIFQHADDTTFFVSSITSIYSILKVLQLYENASGSMCNKDKTELLTIGKSYIDPTDFGFPVRTDFINILGVAVGNDKKQIDFENWDDKVKKCISILKCWKFRKLSFKGKALVVNSLVISKLNYLVSILPVPDWVITSIRKAVTEFIWGGNKPKIKYTNLLLPIEKGGINLCDLGIRRDSFRIKLVAKLLSGKLDTKLHFSMLYFLNHYANMQLGLSIFQICCVRKCLVGIHPFYCELLVSWGRLTCGRFSMPLTRSDILFLPIFHNPLICNESGESLFIADFIDGGIVRISDLMYEVIPNQLPAEAVYEAITLNNPDNTLSVDEVEDYIAIIINALPESWITEIYSSDKVVSSQTDNYPSIHFYSGQDTIDATSLTCRKVSQLFRSQLDSRPKGEDYWTNRFPSLTFNNRWANIFRMPKNFHDADIDFKIMHNILFTNEKLYKFRMIDSPMCSFCDCEIESIVHLFIDCGAVKTLLDNLITKLNRIANINDTNQWKLAILFGLGWNKKRKDGAVIDFVINVYKCVVWNSRISKITNDYNVDIAKFFHNTLKLKLDLLFQVYRKNNNLSNFYELFGKGGVLLSENTNYSYNYHLDRG